MSELEPRSRGRISRREREQRAYRLVLATGALTAVAVVGFVLAVLGMISGALPVVAAVLAVVCVLLLRRTLRP